METNKNKTISIITFIQMLNVFQMANYHFVKQEPHIPNMICMDTVDRYEWK